VPSAVVVDGVDTVDIYHVDAVDVKCGVESVDAVDVHHVDRMDVDAVDCVDVSPTSAEGPGSKRNTALMTGRSGAYEG
jgi:hypothetical protein